MYRIGLFLMVLMLTAASVFAEDALTNANDLELVQSLSSRLAVNPEQAVGVAGTIFAFAKERLSSEDFGVVSNTVPGMDLLLNAAPEEDDAREGTLRGMSPKLTGLASMVGSFKKLGLDADMIGKFVPEILGFVQSKGGDAVKDILGGVLK